MSTDLHFEPFLPLDPNFGPTALSIDTYSYDDRRIIYPAISEALELCGCWLLDRRPLSLTQVEFCFELHLCGIVDLYAGLIAAGLELTRESHKDLTVLCALRQHGQHPTAPPTVVTVTLRVNFLEDVGIVPRMARTVAQA